MSYFVAPLAGVGYKIIKSNVRNLSVDGAAGAEVESTTGLGRSTSGALKAGEDFDWTLSPTSKITQKVSSIWKTKDFGDALYHFDAGVTTTVAARVELKFAYVYDYKTRPAFGAKKGDSALFAALLLPARYTRGSDLLIVAAFYVLAKICETADHQIFSVGHIVRGHTLKHLSAGAAGFWILRMIQKRQPFAGQ